uniref:Acyltransferase 3 domain-containing protein n=1 Tax=Heliothis virescens TaxID=7102 RepID=A0A2A4K959_HELVI
MKLWWWLLLLAAQTQARDVTDEEYAQFPRLFHLDEWETCLARPGALYCLGTFSVEPLRQPSPLYNMLKEYSMDPHHFNRTQLHRGYCVSSRCPGLAGERNASRRFEHCAAQWARRVALRPRLAQLRFCRSHAQHVARAHSHEPPQRAQRMFLLAVTAILFCNVVGTAYDVLTGDNAKKNPVLVSWSIPSNWRRLTASYEDGDPRLAALSPVQGVRVFLMLLIMATHSGCIHDMLYLYNPRWIEQVARHPVLMIFLNGTSVVQVFVLLSNFLLAYNLLLYSKDNSISFRLLPYITVKRIARISPVYLLVVGYAATWWPSLSSGPQWTAAVAAESDACKRKFWTHALYLNNLINPEDICLVQTWFLAVDMQLYVLASVLTVVLARHRTRALRVLAALACLSCVLNGVLAYIFNWKSIVYFAYPNNVRTMYAGIPSFSWLYQAPWGSLPACLIGLFLGFLHYEMQENGVKLTAYKWVRVPYHLSPPLIMWWVLSGGAVRTQLAPWFTVTYAALERPVLSLLAGAILIGMVNGLEGWLKHIFAWRGWFALGRMSLSVLLLHWCINLSIAASRPQPIYSSLLSAVVDWLATSCLSYAAAVPLTLLLEMPALRTVNSLLMNKQKQA